jgi:hypothetical protein
MTIVYLQKNEEASKDLHDQSNIQYVARSGILNVNRFKTEIILVSSVRV